MLKLMITKKQETLIYENKNQEVKINLPLFGISRELLRAFSPIRALLFQYEGEIPPKKDIHEAIINFYSSFKKKDMIGRYLGADKAFIPKFMPGIWDFFWGHLINPDDTSFWYFIESECFRQAIIDWLIPKKESDKSKVYLKPKEMFIRNTFQTDNGGINNSWLQQILNHHDLESYPHEEIIKLINKVGNVPFVFHHERGKVLTPDQWQIILLSGYREFVFRHRTRQVGTEIFAKPQKEGEQEDLYYLYCSDSLLPLAWIELMWAVEHNTYAHICQICDGVFEITKPYRREVYTCPGDCTKQQVTQRMGGEEKKKEYFREAKRKSRENSRNYILMKNKPKNQS